MRRVILILIACLLSIASFALENREYLVKDYGVINDGVTLNTHKIQELIDMVSSSGGGTIVFTDGLYLTGSIQMKSNVSINVKKGATILGSTNPYDYNTNFKMEGRPHADKVDDNSQMALIFAFKANNIRLFGDGKIDGRGRELALCVDSLHHIGERVDTKYNYKRMRPNETARPKLFRFSMCRGVNINNLYLTNSACWGVSFELCRDLILDGVTILNRAYWNNDGCDITDCVNVKIVNCNINSADDGICLKSYFTEYANDSIYIANSTIRTSASAIKFGSASYGGFKNVKIENIKVFDTFRSVIAIESVDGAEIENINVSNIVAKNTGNALFIRIGHRAGKRPGSIKGVNISDISVEVPFGRPDEDYDLRGPEVNFFHNAFPASIVGLPNALIESVNIENVEIIYPGRASKAMGYIPLTRLQQVPQKVKDYPEFSMFGELPSWAFYVRNVKGVTFKNIKLKLNDYDFRPAFIFDNVNEVNMNNISLPEGYKNQVVFKSVEESELDSILIKQRLVVDEN